MFHVEHWPERTTKTAPPVPTQGAVGTHGTPVFLLAALAYGAPEADRVRSRRPAYS